MRVCCGCPVMPRGGHAGAPGHSHGPHLDKVAHWTSPLGADLITVHRIFATGELRTPRWGSPRDKMQLRGVCTGSWEHPAKVHPIPVTDTGIGVGRLVNMTGHSGPASRGPHVDLCLPLWPHVGLCSKACGHSWD